MWQRKERDLDNDLFLAGERVRPGTYRQVGGGRQVLVEQEDFLPASLDGRVACYMLVNDTWEQLSQQAVVKVEFSFG